MGGSRHCASSSVVCAALERAEQLAMDAEAAEFESALSAPDERPELAQVQAKLAASELAAELAAQAAAAISTDSNAGERAPTASPACSAVTELRRPTVAGAPTVTPAVAPTAGTSAPAVRAPAARAPAATETPTNAARSEPADVQAASVRLVRWRLSWRCRWALGLPGPMCQPPRLSDRLMRLHPRLHARCTLVASAR